MALKYKQGLYRPVHPEKYQGNPNQIVYRSSWEKVFMKWCDGRENVLQWSSEEFFIPYFYDLDQKMHRYFVDFMVVMIDSTGKQQKLLIEVKPRSEINRPVEPKKKTPKTTFRYNQQIATWIKNQCKWEAAKSYAQARGMKFVVMDEFDLGIAKRK